MSGKREPMLILNSSSGFGKKFPPESSENTFNPTAPADQQAKELYEFLLSLSQKNELSTRWQREQWCKEMALLMKQDQRDLIVIMNKEIKDKASRFILAGHLAMVDQVIVELKKL